MPGEYIMACVIRATRKFLELEGIKKAKVHTHFRLPWRIWRDKEAIKRLSRLIEAEIGDDYMSVPSDLGRAKTMPEIARVIESRELGRGV